MIASGKEPEGALIERPPHGRTSSVLACTHIYIPAVHTPSTYRTGCKCQRQLGEKAGRPTSRPIHRWIRKQANITDNKQMISVLRPGGFGYSPAASGSNPPRCLSVQAEGRSLPITLRSHNSPNKRPNSHAATAGLSASRCRHSVYCPFNFVLNTVMY